MILLFFLESMLLVQHKYKSKTQIYFLKLSILGFPIEFKHMIALINETQIMLFFLMNI